MWSGLDLTLVIALGLLIAGGGLAWLWREQTRPSLVDRQEGTIGRLYDRGDRMQDEIDELRREIVSLHQLVAENHEAYEEELAELRAVLDEWWHGMRLVFEQMAAASLDPVWQPKPIPPKRKRAKAEPPRSQLAATIAEKFSIDEMNTLAYDIGVLPEEIAGSTVRARADALVELCHRRGETGKLAAKVKELRA